MFKLISSFFTKKNMPKPSSVAIKQKSLDDLFLWHLDDLSYFKDESYPTVLRHLKHEIDLNKTGDKLTTEQKKELGMNTRLSITTDLVQVLSEKGLSLSNPKKALEQVYYRATMESSRLDNLQKMISAGVTEAVYRACSDERDCPWCKEHNGSKFHVSEAINDEIKDNCTCDWNRGYFEAVLK